MARRIALEIVLIIGMTVAVAWLILGLFSLADATDAASAFFDQTPRVLFGVLGIALGLFAVFVTIGAIAWRRPGRIRIVSHVVSLVLAIAVNVALLALVTMAAGGGGGGDGAGSWGMLVLAIAAAAGAALLIAGLTAILLVELVILRPKPGPPAPAEAENSSS